MPIRLFATAVLVLLSSTLAGAATFKCTRPDGTTIFTDDPAQVPGDCLLEKFTELPPLGILPETPPLQAPPATLQRPGTARTDTGGTQSFDAFKSETALLLEKYQAARRKFFQSSFAKDQLDARRELADLRAQKNALLEAIEQSSLSVAEKRDLAGRLAAITD
jgi:hypothetical protein